MNAQYNEILRFIRNMIPLALSSKPTLMPVAAVCRPAHVHRLASVADPSRRSFAHMVAPSVGEQVLILAVGGELDTGSFCRGFIPAITPRRRRRRMPAYPFP